MQSCRSRNKCAWFFCSEFHYSKLCFCYESSTAFAYSPWLPYTWKFQWIFVLYRWIIAAYFFGWLIESGVSDGSPKYFIYLTYLSFILWNAYLIVAAASVTFYYFYRNFCHSTGAPASESNFGIEVEAPVSVGCCGVSSDESTWYQKVQWFFFLVSTAAAVLVTILFWSLLYATFGVDKVSVNVHLVNGIVALVDLWFSGTPVRLFHVVYIMFFGAVYVAFSGIYYATGAEAIYPVLDYGEDPGTASVAAILTVIVAVPIVHCALYAQYAARFWITYYLRKKYGPYRHIDEQPTGMYSNKCGVL